MNTPTLLKTIHGSHLYGLAHANSDLDTYLVRAMPTPRGQGARRRNKHEVDGQADVTEVLLSSFMQQCEKGVPQALEAMFSPLAEPGLGLESLRQHYQANTGHVAETYPRTAKKMALQDDFKHKRHGVRLVLNLNEMLTSRRTRFNPTLTPDQKTMATEMAEDPDYLPRLRSLSILELDF